ncbi:MAG: sigma-70 family RNA polymerase sigma factor [Bacteroidales bacterium]|nr:sigma-70 family RNA polymerase sigma factor [Bacteroidales bacterium]
MDFAHSTHIQDLLNQLRDGRVEARDELIAHAMERVRALARRMFRVSPALRAVEETDDILQRTLLRLRRSLGNIQPTTVRGFFALAARQIRWALQDVARELAATPLIYTGVHSPESSVRNPEPADPGAGPTSLVEWTEFHQAVERLPDEAREVFDLVWYEGLNQVEAAALLGVPLRTLKRRWRLARELLSQALYGEPPDG